jgi:hypothetical protein
MNKKLHCLTVVAAIAASSRRDDGSGLYGVRRWLWHKERTTLTRLAVPTARSITFPMWAQSRYG